MYANIIHLFFEACKLGSQNLLLVCDSFQLLLLSGAFTAPIHTLAVIVSIVLFVLIAARILCIYCGKYFYDFPEGMQR